MKLVLDSDVVIAGLISSKGAGHFLLSNFLPHKKVKIFTSKEQIKEIELVMRRPSFIWQANKKLWESFKKDSAKVKLSPKSIKKLTNYLNDPSDVHILAAAISGKARFLLTYNIKHYQREKIKEDFNLLVVRPGFFLQYWRLRERE
ncbi:putative toxin-antitoxin system toxin component, PIN family [Candidatus Microgenomates bacterium]|nr:putative toxin-antitoxin system toxin component, PIN family [Candidatus Microgenomates bacterium]